MLLAKSFIIGVSASTALGVNALLTTRRYLIWFGGSMLMISCRMISIDSGSVPPGEGCARLALDENLSGFFDTKSRSSRRVIAQKSPPYSGAPLWNDTGHCCGSVANASKGSFSWCVIGFIRSNWKGHLSVMLACSRFCPMG